MFFSNMHDFCEKQRRYFAECSCCSFNFFFHDLQCRHFFFFLLQNIFNYFYFNRLFIFIFRNIINNIIIYFKIIFYVVIGDCVQHSMVSHVPAV